MGFFVRPVEYADEVRFEVVAVDNADGYAVIASFPPGEEAEARVCVERLQIIVAQELNAAPGAIEGVVI